METISSRWRHNTGQNKSASTHTLNIRHNLTPENTVSSLVMLLHVTKETTHPNTDWLLQWVSSGYAGVGSIDDAN